MLLTSLAACSSGNTTTNKGVPQSPTSTLSPDQQPPLSIQAAWGNVTIHKVPIALPDNHVFTFSGAATPDGQWLIGANDPRNFTTNTTQLPVAVLLNVTTQQIVTMQPLLHPQSQIVGASADDRWVVWAEADDQPSFFDWTIFAYDRESGQVTQLARATKVNGQPAQGPYPVPTVDHGEVLWNQPIGTVSPTTLSNAVVRLDDLATGTVSTVATQAGGSALSWPWALWDQGDQTNGSVMVKNLETGQTLQIAEQPATAVISGTSVAFDDISSAYLLDDVTKSTTDAQTVATAADGDHIQFVTLNDRVVAWQSNHLDAVYDRAEQRLVNLPVQLPHGGVTGVSGRTLVWIDPEPEPQYDQDIQANLFPLGTLEVLDTSTLPVLPAH